MSAYLRSYLTATFLAAAAFILVGGTLSISRAIRPKNPSKSKLTAYESGVDPVGTGWSQSQIRYYIYALLFVMFDVEAVFLFPWALRLEAFGGFGLIEMGIFVFILLLGLLYAWKKGVLRWV
jgi:NADH-quinone oxidoreductase subunit A